MRHLIVHILCGRLGFFDAFISFVPLFQDDRIPRPQIFLGFFQQAQAAVLLNVLKGRAAPLQALDALHPVHGFFGEHPAVAAVPLTGQQSFVRIKAQGMLGHAEHLCHLLDRIDHIHIPVLGHPAAFWGKRSAVEKQPVK